MRAILPALAVTGCAGFGESCAYFASADSAHGKKRHDSAKKCGVAGARLRYTVRMSTHLERPSGPAPAGHRPEPTQEEIQHAAYFLWLEHGRPLGGDLDFWREARERLRHRQVGPDGAGPDALPVHFPHGPTRPGSAAAHPPPPTP